MAQKASPQHQRDRERQKAIDKQTGSTEAEASGDEEEAATGSAK